MEELLCLDDVPYQCQDCGSHFPTENSLLLHCFVEGHKRARPQRARDQYSNQNCDCGQRPNEPHQCNTCRLIGISVEGRTGGTSASEKVYTQSQLWKCTGCGMLWKCVECGVLFKGSGEFKKHLPNCNSIEDVLRRMKTEKGSDENESDVKENIAVKEEKHNTDVKFPIKREINANLKEEKFDPDVKFPIKSEVMGNIKQEKDFTDNKLSIKRDVDGNVKSENGNIQYHLRRKIVNGMKQEPANAVNK